MDKINKYKVDKLVSEHVSDLKFGEGGDKSIFILGKGISPTEAIFYNFDEAEIYLAEVSGKHGYSNGKAICLTHPSIPNSSIMSQLSGIQGTRDYGGYLDIPNFIENANAITFKLSLHKLPEDAVYYFLVGNSKEQLESMTGPIYDVRNFERLGKEIIREYTGDKETFGIREIGFHYAKV